MIKDKEYYLSLKFGLSRDKTFINCMPWIAESYIWRKNLIELKVKAKSYLIKMENLNVSLLSVTDKQNQ